MKEMLKKLYGEQGEVVYHEILDLISAYQNNEAPKEPLSEKDCMIITYGDSIINKQEEPLKVLKTFLNRYVKDSINAVHILPMFPYTSDDGFSVTNYLEINPTLGNWDDIEELSKDYHLMFDAVINHISKESDWFKGYLNGEETYQNFFIECDPFKDYSKVVRPRSLPLYYPYQTIKGTKYLWATFSEDQLDLNYHNKEVLLKVLKVLLEYSKRGAKFIRFDAVGFLWKKSSTSCMHLEETHLLVKIMRQVLEATYPNTRIITETNVPHLENITYFGNGFDEAHLVYQFPLPPLTLFTFLKQDATKLTAWVKSLEKTKLSADTTYFNFLASHDGIGMRPTEGILSDSDRALMLENTINNNGKIGYKVNPDGTKTPYELNINYLDALCREELPITQKVQKFMASQIIMLSMQGVPGIYIHSLLGSQNDLEGLKASQIKRRINREKLLLDQLMIELDYHQSLKALIFNEYLKLLNIRKQHSAFSPRSTQEVLKLSKAVFALIRYNQSTNEKVLLIVNITNEKVTLKTNYQGINILNNDFIKNDIRLLPYDYIWLKLGV